jgi:hypothetical protein
MEANLKSILNKTGEMTQDIAQYLFLHGGVLVLFFNFFIIFYRF